MTCSERRRPAVVTRFVLLGIAAMTLVPLPAAAHSLEGQYGYQDLSKDEQGIAQHYYVERFKHDAQSHNWLGRDSTRMAQMRYSSSGTHQCEGGGRSCIVSGQFGDCNDATISLRTRDCCPTTRNGASSTRFTLNYCIPETFRRRELQRPEADDDD
jgi:hypothetical protein